MGIDLEDMIDVLAVHIPFEYMDWVMAARQGDWQAAAHIADAMRAAGTTSDELYVPHTLYEWLADAGKRKYEAYQLEIEHFLDPSLPYTDGNIQRFMNECQRGDLVNFGMLVKAVRSNSAFYEKYKQTVSRVYMRMSGSVSVKDKAELANWGALLDLHHFAGGSSEALTKSMEVLQEGINQDSVPYIAIAYLEEAIRQQQQGDYLWVCEGAIACLENQGRLEDRAFYIGLKALCDGRYKTAFNSFSTSQDKRCQLAQAYCLINGMGCKADQRAARELLKAYPDDAFGLYLLAISLYRDNRDRNQIPPEVSELLTESKKLGYQPAEATLCMMRLALLHYAGDQQDMRSLILEIKRLEKSDGEIFGCDCFLSHMNVVHKKVLDAYRESKGNPKNFKYPDGLEEIVRAAIRLTEQQAPVSGPLANYAMALIEANSKHETDIYLWASGIMCFNQSPKVRRWALNNALVYALFDGDDDQAPILLQYLLDLGGSEREVATWNAALSIQHQKEYPRLRKALSHGFGLMLQAEKNSPLVKLLNRVDCMDQGWKGDCIARLRQTLLETQKVTDSRLLCLRNQLICLAGLQDEFPLKFEADHLDTNSLTFIEQFIGYAFFDYHG